MVIKEHYSMSHHKHQHHDSPMSFHIHLPHIHVHHHHSNNQENKKDLKDIPKGCLAVIVGQGEEQQRFVIPVMYVNHPLFIQLLKEAEDEYGFDQKGPITIPCHVEEFRSVQDSIDKETRTMFHHHHHHSHNHHVWCFKV